MQAAMHSDVQYVVNAKTYKLRFCTLILYAVVLAVFSHWLTFDF